jgi:hypothetical protein
MVAVYGYIALSLSARSFFAPTARRARELRNKSFTELLAIQRDLCEAKCTEGGLPKRMDFTSASCCVERQISANSSDLAFAA